ncbi:MAG: hypothetical protein LBK18_01725 [Prevotellaceae bacterium]|jgi:hypothetical protein|nr:hypothetical protein [Prevotellaceae bacterium]
MEKIKNSSAAAQRLLKALAAVAIACSSASCVKDTDAGATAVQALSGEWWVKVYNADMSAAILPYKRMATYNTASNTSTEMIVDDYRNIFNDSLKAGMKPAFRVKTPCSVSNKTFGADATTPSLLDAAYTYIVKNGRIVANGAKSPGGLTTDSIYFQLTDVLNSASYALAGYRHTGWSEDGH